MVESAIFWIFALLAVGGALGAVFHRSIVYAALFLIVVFLSIAGFFVLNNADFLALAQVIIYAVGLTIILLFAIMFTGDRRFEDRRVSRVTLVVAGLVVSYLFALLARTILPFAGAPAAVNPALSAVIAEQGTTRLLGLLLFTRYALPFELASILLLIAMLGAIVIAKKRFVESESTLGNVGFPMDSDDRLSPGARKAVDARTRLAAGIEPVREECLIPSVEPDQENVGDDEGVTR